MGHLGHLRAFWPNSYTGATNRGKTVKTAGTGWVGKRVKPRRWRDGAENRNTWMRDTGTPTTWDILLARSGRMQPLTSRSKPPGPAEYGFPAGGRSEGGSAKGHRSKGAVQHVSGGNLRPRPRPRLRPNQVDGELSRLPCSVTDYGTVARLPVGSGTSSRYTRVGLMDAWPSHRLT